MYKRMCIAMSVFVALVQIAWAFGNYWAWCWLVANISWLSRCAGTEPFVLAWAIVMSIVFVICDIINWYMLLHATDN